MARWNASLSIAERWVQRAFKPAGSDMKYLQDFGLPDNVVASGRLSKTVGVESRWTLARLRVEKQFGRELLIWLSTG